MESGAPQPGQDTLCMAPSLVVTEPSARHISHSYVINFSRFLSPETSLLLESCTV